ncbi:MAG: hypothetical protein AAB834_04010, partial [Patescibacteria group bacterium]
MAKAQKTASTKVTAKQDSVPRPADVAVEWICFGLWGWTLLALSILLSATLTYYFVETAGDYEFAVYVLGAMICLLPFALVAESMYAKREPDQKHGFAGVVMVLNAVVVFLVTVAALITAAVSALSIFVHAHASSGTHVTIISSLVITVLGLMLFGRIINPPSFKRFSKLFPWLVLLISGITVAAAGAGPFKEQINSRDDRFIEDNLSTLNEAIRGYTNSNQSPPASLDQVGFDRSYEEGAKALVDRDLVAYTPDTKDSKAADGYTTFYYRLCVTYKKAKGNKASTAVTKDLYNVNS